MSEQFTKLLSLPPDLYAEGSPLIVSAGNLLKDNQTGQVLVQLKIKNIAPKTVKAATVAIRALDTIGRPIEGDAAKEYLDLFVRQGEEFGQKAAIPLPNPSTRGVTVAVQEAVFGDNSAYEGTDAPWEPLPAATPLTRTLEDLELVKQYELTFGGPCQVTPQEHKDLWQCACGAWNREGTCYACRKGKSALFSLDLESLKADKNARLAREKAEREAKEAAEKAAVEQAAAEAAARAKKSKKILAILIPAAAVCLAAILLITKVIIPNSHYKKAMALLDAGRYEEAIPAFEALDGYKDSAAQIEAAKAAKVEQENAAAYEKAASLQAAGQFEEAIQAYTALNGYRDSAAQIEACITAIYEPDYTIALELFAAKKYAQAAQKFFLTAGFKDSDSYLMKCRMKMGNTIATGYYYTVGLKADGTAVAIGNNSSGQCNVSSWKDIVAIAAGWDHTVGLKADGTLVAVGDNDYGECSVSGWTNIVAIAADSYHTVGLKADGTVMAVGQNKYGQCNVSGWTGIVAIEAGGAHTVGLKADGTVVANVYTGDKKYYYGECDVYGWTDIVAIAAGGAHTVGLKADGTVVAVGYNGYGQCDVSGWTGIVAIAAGISHTVGLKADGTVVANVYTGDKKYYYGRCDVSAWTDIVAITAGNLHTLGLKADGTVVAVGDNEYGQCDVSSWRNIRVPER